VRRRHEALDADESGSMLNGAGLAYPESTTSIRLGDDGPVASTGALMAGKEQLMAYCVVDCENAERAASIAERSWTCTSPRWRCGRSTTSSAWIRRVTGTDGTNRGMNTT
jgi:hypothetical protein